MDVHIEKTWKEFLKDEFKKDYFLKLSKTVREAYLEKTIFPPPEYMFGAFNHCHFDKVKVVILGQDPYHGIGQAHGLSFSVQDGVRIPPSLRNIYKELQDDTGIKQPYPYSGNLTRWADQGVLLLNATLTVEKNIPGSHQGIGWEQFTDTVIQKLSDEKEHLVFILWGKYAQDKGKNIDYTKHLVLQSPHPSPFAARRGFFGCKHFSKTNWYLKKHDRGEIEW